MNLDRRISEKRRELEELERQAKPAKSPAESNDFLWGAEAIGEFLGLKGYQVRYLLRKGSFGNAVTKLSGKTIVGSRRKLKAMFEKTS